MDTKKAKRANLDAEQNGSISSLARYAGARVRALRRQRRWSQSRLAEICGLSARYVSLLELGKANISLAKLEKITAAFEISASHLLQRLGPAGKEPTLGNPEETTMEHWRGRIAALDSVVLQRLQSMIGERLRLRRRIRVALLGMRGAGKSTVGTALAKVLRFLFVELDWEIEKLAGISLQDVFEIHGETLYRRLESEALERIDLESHGRGVILATGGGIVQNQPVFSRLQRSWLTVWLKVSPEIHWQRVLDQGDTRPMRNRPSAKFELRQLWKQRRDLYAACDIALENEGNITNTVDEIRSLLHLQASSYTKPMEPSVGGVKTHGSAATNQDP